MSISNQARVFFVILLWLATGATAAEIAGQLNRNKVVGLDHYYNNEFKVEAGQPPKPFHYLWQDQATSGFSGLAAIIQGLGSQVATVAQAPDKANLEKLSIYIIVDPDTPRETAAPQFVAEQEAVAVAQWVQAGGILVLLANDKNNCELEHFNILAEQFGIHFNEDLRNPVIDNKFEMARFDVFPQHPLFVGVGQIYLKEICTLRLQTPAQPVLQDGADVIMALAVYGQGKVFAVGDPWFYNEYLDGYKLPPEYENTKAASNLFLWLLSMAKEPRQL
jgi:unsaturated rhamnogalacturonyl hydrolase